MKSATGRSCANSFSIRPRAERKNRGRLLHQNQGDLCPKCVLSGVRSMNEVYPLDRVAEAYDRMMSGKARFRVVLEIGK